MIKETTDEYVCNRCGGDELKIATMEYYYCTYNVDSEDGHLEIDEQNPDEVINEYIYCPICDKLPRKSPLNKIFISDMNNSSFILKRKEKESENNHATSN